MSSLLEKAPRSRFPDSEDIEYLTFVLEALSMKLLAVIR